MSTQQLLSLTLADIRTAHCLIKKKIYDRMTGNPVDNKYLKLSKFSANRQFNVEEKNL